ncbi:T9SS type A sorting domain-containing protein [Fibrella aquatilis]|uniref:T9SS type A sorting domain-containing protein n=1 Tax=Fibrella aquatilis TaxID=2817059 RepID=A0A939G1D8_9BACT|nr:T9SS type A sorting domain-containing protein [Fibrella aquatilis]MBO0930214.1 T9SS type A sorting domain-containing protein [Fibrella aquatilis]
MTLTSFRAVVNGGRVDLSWQLPTSGAEGSFVVERSRDAREWAQIGFQTPFPDQRYFGHTDAKPLPGQSYYRIRHIQADGLSTLSHPVAVTVDDQLPGLTILTNPSSGDRLTLLPQQLPGADYQLATLTGQHLPCQTSETPDGQMTLLPQHRLPPGVYLLTATTGTVRLTRRVLVQ